MLNKIVAHTRTGCKFDVRNYIEIHNGRAACPSCEHDGKIQQKNLQVNDDGKYWCYRGCTSEQIRSALGAPLPGHSATLSDPLPTAPAKPSTPERTVSADRVAKSVNRLLTATRPDQQQALTWLTDRGLTPELLQEHRLGLERYTPSQSNTSYWAIALHIPVPHQPGQFYRKLRIAPWLTGDDRPAGLSRWSQFGVPTTVWITYQPPNATETWFCEGEWDALRLGWEAQQHNAAIAIACSTSGCGTVPSLEQLDQLPGNVTIFFDRNDQPRKDGVIPGDAGAQKLALALRDRSTIAQVPMPDDCPIHGWDVSNALDVGYTWADFLSAAATAQPPELPTLSSAASPQSLRDQILTILRQHESPGQRELTLMELAQATGYYYRDISQLAKALAIEVDLQIDQVDAIQKLHTLLNTRHTKLDLHRYLEPWFADVLTATAQAMPTAPEMLFTTLLPAAASRIGTAARIIVKPSAKYTQPLVFWTAIVADSGALKTPVQRVITDPLVNLEKEAHERHQLDLADYRIEQQSGQKSSEASYRQPPTRKRYITKDVTLETLQRIHSENPRGLLYYRDELVGNAKSRNMYRGGVGADEEAELDQWNGAAILYDRADKSVCLSQSAVSRTGAYQWETLSQLMGDHTDFNGGFARWLMCAPKLPRRYLRLLQDDQDTGISDALTGLYRDLETLPSQDYLLSYEAKQLLETWQHQLVDAQISEPAVGLRAVYPKIESYTSRLALWLHLVNATLRHDRPGQVISGDTMEKAIELAAYYLWQYRLIYTHNSPDAGLEGPSLKLQRYAEKVGQINASQAKSGVYALRRLPVEQIRQLMQTLAAAGHGLITGEEADMIYSPVNQPSQPKQTNRPLPTEVPNPTHQQLINSPPQSPVLEHDRPIDLSQQLLDQPSTDLAPVVSTITTTTPNQFSQSDPSPPSAESCPDKSTQPHQSRARDNQELAQTVPDQPDHQAPTSTPKLADSSTTIDPPLLNASTSQTLAEKPIQPLFAEVDPVATPPLSAGDRVQYIGQHPHWQQQYSGDLTIQTITVDGIACLTNDQRITTWLPPADLQRLE